MSFTVVIPARYDSTRLPGKPLVELAGLTMIERVVKQVKQTPAHRIIVATDDERIKQVVLNQGIAQVVMTDATHPSGTDRIAQVVRDLDLSDDEIVVNVQGDEPLLPPELVQQVADALAAHPEAMVSTLATPIKEEIELNSPACVKVVCDRYQKALYFSRSVIPFDRGNLAPKLAEFQYLRHIGLYAYRVGFVKAYQQLSLSPLEQIESLEQLRVLWHGYTIQVGLTTTVPPAGIDTPEDVSRVLKHLQHAE